MQWRFSAPDAAAALPARHQFADVLRSWCLGDGDWTAAEIVFGELVANVMRHAPGPIDIRMAVNGGGFVILTVSDRGPAFRADAPALPSAGSESGRGLYIVSQLCRGVAIERTARGNVVTVVLPIAICGDDAQRGDETATFRTRDGRLSFLGRSV